MQNWKIIPQIQKSRDEVTEVLVKEVRFFPIMENGVAVDFKPLKNKTLKMLLHHVQDTPNDVWKVTRTRGRYSVTAPALHGGDRVGSMDPATFALRAPEFFKGDAAEIIQLFQ